MYIPRSKPLHIGYYGSPHARNIGIEIDDASRFQHMFIAGQTGTGKSTLLKYMAIQDIYEGQGVCFIDPHGVDAPELLEYIPPERMRDVVYFDATDTQHVVGFNPLSDIRSTNEKDKLTKDIVSGFHSLWADSWGPRMEPIFKHAVRAVLDIPSPNSVHFVGVLRMFEDAAFRRWVIERIRQHRTRQFWTEDFGRRWTKQQQTDWPQPVENKVGQFANSDLIRNMITQPSSTFDIEYMMDNNKILIVNLNKGMLGDDTNLLGMLLLTKIKSIAMNRHARLGSLLPHFHVYVDEFQSFTSLELALILSELRKYRVSFTLATQYLRADLTTVDKAIYKAVIGNVGTFLSFRVGAEDAPQISKQVDQTEEHLVDQEDYKFSLRTKQGTSSSTYIGSTTLPDTGDELPASPHYRFGRADRIVEYSRNRYTTTREKIERRYERWLTDPRFR